MNFIGGRARTSLTALLLSVIGLPAMAQSTITGTVVDRQDQPLPGVTVMDKGTNKGTITDIRNERSGTALEC